MAICYSCRGIYLRVLGFILVVPVLHGFEFSIKSLQANLGLPSPSDTDKCEAVAEPFKSCACKMHKSGEVINLNGIINNCSYTRKGCVTPRFTVSGAYTKDDWFYSFHPCKDFSLFQNETHVYPGYRPCKNVAAARYTSLSTHRCDGLGKQDNAVFKTRPIDVANFIVSNLTLEFQNKTTKNSAVISLVCNTSRPVNESKMSFLGVKNKPFNAYFMALESRCCCPDGCYFAFSPVIKTKAKPTKDFWYIVAIAGGIILLLVICLSVTTCQRKKDNHLRKPLLDPLT